MLHPQEKELMFKFLKRNYPTSRIKDNMRFKRGIVLDDGIYYLSNKEMANTLYFKMLSILELVFCTEKSINEDVLKTFLHLK